MLGRTMADAINVGVGDVITLGESRFRVVGIFESGTGWEELGGVITLHDAQAFAGRPRKVTFFAVDIYDPTQAREIAELINTNFPEAHASLAGEFAEQLPDLQNSEAMLDGISIMAILVGGIGVMNTMLMAVLERTREIGVLRALGWRRKSVLGLILREAWLLGVLGGLVGIGVAFGLNFLLTLVPLVSDTLNPIWSTAVFFRAAVVALALGLAGGLYPAFRATLLQPVEALRYE
jgi:putative ABC transport system permease protein